MLTNFFKPLSKLLNCLSIKGHSPSQVSASTLICCGYIHARILKMVASLNSAVFKIRPVSFSQFIDLSVHRISVGILLSISNTQKND